MDIWYSAVRWIARTYRTLFIEDLRVYGLEKVPEGPKIFIANHPNTVNGLMLPLIFPERLYFLVHHGSFTLPVLGFLLKMTGQIPVAPGRGRLALQMASERLQHGDSIVILPEGRTTRRGQQRRFGTGAVRLALKARQPIVPVGFYVPEDTIKTIPIPRKHGADEGYFQVGGPCCVQVGAPWYPEDAADEPVNGVRIRALTDQLMARVRVLAEQAAEWRFA